MIPLRLLLLACLTTLPWRLAGEAQFAPRVMIVATFEIGADRGDKPGEFQYWAERENLTNTVAVPGLSHPLVHDGRGVWGMVSGTTVRSGLNLLTVGLDPRFDFRRTYWLINGIAGVDPEDASVASAAWARHVIDGDIAYEVDSREAPADWPYGVVPIGGKRPNEKPSGADWAPKPMVWTLNPGLVDWAFQLTRTVEIPENEPMKKLRATFTRFPNARKPPFVLLGDSLASCRYWHGATLNRWANDWSRLHGGLGANYVMTNMEDHGLAAALVRLQELGRADFQRVLVLRTGSNYSMPPGDQGVAESMTAEYEGMIPALEAAHRVGSPVVHALVRDWERYALQPPHP